MSLHLPTSPDQALEAYNHDYGHALLYISLAYLVLVVVEMMPGVGLGPVLMFIDGVFWAVFVADYVVRVFFLAPNRWKYALKPLSLLDLVVIASFPVLLVLGSGVLGLARIARVATQIMRSVRVGAQAGRTAGEAHRIFSRHSLRWIIPAGLVLAAILGVAVWRFEGSRADANIQTAGDAAWWTVATLTTVGANDLDPHTTAGRSTAIALMVLGAVVFGWITASLASLFVKNDNPGTDREVSRKLDRLADDNAVLHRKIDDLMERLNLADRRDEAQAELGGPDVSCEDAADHANRVSGAETI